MAVACFMMSLKILKEKNNASNAVNVVPIKMKRKKQNRQLYLKTYNMSTRVVIRMTIIEDQ